MGIRELPWPFPNSFSLAAREVTHAVLYIILAGLPGMAARTAWYVSLAATAAAGATGRRAAAVWKVLLQ